MAALSFHYHNVLPFFGNQPLFYTGVGLCSLWLESIRTLGMAIERMAFIFGGAIFPLSIYPRWFVEIAQWTPFYSVYYLSIKLVYDFSWANLAQAVLLNTFWITLIVGSSSLLTENSLKR